MRSARLLAVAVLVVVLALSSAQNAFAATELYYDDGDAEAGIYSEVVGGRFAVRFSLPAGWSAAQVVGVRFYSMSYGPAIVRIYGSLQTECNGVELTSFSMTFGWSGWNDKTGLTGVTVTGDFCVAAENPERPPPPNAWPFYVGQDDIVPPRVDPQRSWYYSPTTGTWTWSPDIPSTLMIRAVVEEMSVLTVRSSTSTTIVGSTSTIYSTMSTVTTVGTSTSTSFATSMTTSGGTIMEYVTEFDTIYGYVLVILKQLQEAVGGVVESANKLSVLAPALVVIGLLACVGTVVVVAKKHR